MTRLATFLALLWLALAASAAPYVKAVLTLPELLTNNPVDVTSQAWVAGFTNYNDGNQGNFIWLASLTAATNASNIFKSTWPAASTTGRWYRLSLVSTNGGGGGFSGSFTNGITNVSGMVQWNALPGANVNFITNNGQVTIAATTGGGATNGIAQLNGFGTNTFLTGTYATRMTNLDGAPFGLLYLSATQVLTNSANFTFDPVGGAVAATILTNSPGREMFDIRAFVTAPYADNVYGGRFTMYVTNGAGGANRIAGELGNLVFVATNNFAGELVGNYGLLEIEGTGNVGTGNGARSIAEQYGSGTITNLIAHYFVAGSGNSATGRVLNSWQMLAEDFQQGGTTNRPSNNYGLEVRTTATNGTLNNHAFYGSGGADIYNLGDITSLATFNTTGALWSNNISDVWLRALNNRNWNFYASGNVFNFWGDNAPNPIDFRLRTTNVLTDLAQFSWWGGIGATNRFGYIQPVLTSGTYPMVFDSLNLSNGVFQSFRFQNGFVRVGEGSILPQSRLEVTNGLASLTADFQHGGSSFGNVRMLAAGNSITNLAVISTGMGSPTAVNVAASGVGTANTALSLVASGAAANYALVTLGGNVGVNIAAPMAQFQVAGASSFSSFITNGGQTASTITAADANKALIGINMGSGVAYNTTTHTLSATGGGGGLVVTNGGIDSTQILVGTSTTMAQGYANFNYHDSDKSLGIGAVPAGSVGVGILVSRSGSITGSSDSGIDVNDTKTGTGSKYGFRYGSSGSIDETVFAFYAEPTGGALANYGFYNANNSPNQLGAGVLLLGNLLIYQNTGSPESVITAPIGSMYLRTDGSYNSAVYAKTNGTGNTGWTPLLGVATGGGGGGALTGTVLSNGVASVSTDLARYVDTTATNITPVHVTGIGPVVESTAASVTNFLMKGMSGTLWTNQTQTAGTLTWANSNGVLASVTASNGILFTNGVLMATNNSGSGSIGGSGTATEVAFFDPDGVTIASDSEFWWDNVNKGLVVGIANGTPITPGALYVTRNGAITTTDSTIFVGNAESSSTTSANSSAININMQDAVTGTGAQSAAIFISGTTANTANYAIYNASTRTNQLGAGTQMLGTVGIFQGTGSPNSALAAPVGSIYLQTDGSYNTTLWGKTNGTSSTGWGAVQMTAGGGGGVTGNLTNAQMVFATGSGTVASTAGLLWDDTNRRVWITGSGYAATYWTNTVANITYGAGVFSDSVYYFVSQNNAGANTTVWTATTSAFGSALPFTANDTFHGVGDATLDGNLSMSTVGKTLSIKSGSNAKSGTFVLSGGTATVGNTSITANSVVCTSIKTSGGTPGTFAPRIVLTASTGFTATGLATDTSTYNYVVFEVN